MKSIWSISSIMTVSVALAFLMAGCHKNNVKDGASTGSQVPAESAGSSTGNGSNAETDAATAMAAGSGATAAGQIIYFDFDKIEIRPEFASIISAQARNLIAHSNQKLRLEGNTDERGTREYNIGLGERRAQAVRRALMLQGVAETQITTVSFGEERPAVEGDDEAAWAKNRRVEMVLVP